MDTILIATNDEGLRGSLHSILAGSHVLFQAGTLRKMLEMLQDKRIDLVIVDETLDNRQVSEFLPEILETQESVLVFVTAADPRAGHVRTARELGACDILTKPIDEWELTDKTRRSLEHAQSLRERTLMRERIEELRATLRISVPKGHEVQMSPRGFPSGKTSETFQPLKTFLEPLANIRDSQKLFDMFVEAIADYFTVTKGALVLAGKDNDKLSVRAFTGLDIELINQINQMKEFDTRHGVYRWLWEKDRILVTEDLGTDELVLVEREAELLKAKLCVPLSLKDREKPLGYVSLGNKLTGELYSTEEQKFIFALARYAAAAIENALLFEETREKAIKDDLTELYRRNYYEQRLETELERSKRYGRSLSVAIFDIDNFKNINETYGHPVGDRVLKAVARLMLRRSRSTDVVGRYGGEEFIAILPETEEKDAHNYCERVRLGVKELGKEEVLPADLTVSGGKTSFDPDKDTAQTIIKRADDALLEAKRSGKDRIRNL